MVKVKILRKVWGCSHLKMYFCDSSEVLMVTSIQVTSLEFRKIKNSPEVILDFLNNRGIQATRLNLKKFSQQNIFFHFWLRNLRVTTPNMSECWSSSWEGLTPTSRTANLSEGSSLCLEGSFPHFFLFKRARCTEQASSCLLNVRYRMVHMTVVPAQLTEEWSVHQCWQCWVWESTLIPDCLGNPVHSSRLTLRKAEMNQASLSLRRTSFLYLASKFQRSPPHHHHHHTYTYSMCVYTLLCVKKLEKKEVGN